MLPRRWAESTFEQLDVEIAMVESQEILVGVFLYSLEDLVLNHI